MTNTTTQQCRDCGEPFPYSADADRCPTCAAAMMDTTDTRTTTRDELVDRITKALDHSLDEWKSGRACSPDERDYVYAAARVLDLHPLQREVVEFYADALYEDAGEEYETTRDIAAFLYDALTAE